MDTFERLPRAASAALPALILDDTGFLKQGRASVGVARQYTGTIGKVTNCQVAVTCVYAERTLAWPVAARLYLPESWCADAARRTKAHIRDTLQFQTKPELALALLDQANAWAFRTPVSQPMPITATIPTFSTAWKPATSTMSSRSGRTSGWRWREAGCHGCSVWMPSWRHGQGAIGAPSVGARGG